MPFEKRKTRPLVEEELWVVEVALVEQDLSEVEVEAGFVGPAFRLGHPGLRRPLR